MLTCRFLLLVQELILGFIIYWAVKMTAVHRIPVPPTLTLDLRNMPTAAGGKKRGATSLDNLLR